MSQRELAEKAARLKEASQARQTRPVLPAPDSKPKTSKRPQRRQHRQQSFDGDGEDAPPVRLLTKAQVRTASTSASRVSGYGCVTASFRRVGRSAVRQCGLKRKSRVGFWRSRSSG
jgi:hypothetical protein